MWWHLSDGNTNDYPTVELTRTSEREQSYRFRMMRYPHWQFFESLDDEFHSLSRMIEFTEDNFSTYSVHLTRLYLSIGSEIDVVSKLLCKRINPTKNPGNIKAYQELITEKYSHFTNVRIVMPSHGLDFLPWSSWDSSVSPKWWKSYNDVKHERSKFYRDSNLGNVLESAAGLLVLLIYFYQPELYDKNSFIQPDFKVMRIETQYAHVLKWGFEYSFPDFD